MRLRLTLCALIFASNCIFPAQASEKVVAISVGGVVHPITVEIVSHALEQARRENAALVLIRLNTPGGLLDATRKAIEKIDASPVPVVTYVTPSGGRAASAGFFLLMSGDVAAMAPGTNTGAASPVLLGHEMDATMRHKVENDAQAFLRSHTDKRGRNSALAEKTISEAKSFTEKEALENKLIELIAKDEQDLIRQLNGRTLTRLDGRSQTLQLTSAAILDYPETIREKIVSAIADPNIGFILLVLGAFGLYLEFSHPGLIFPGVAGAIILLLALSALSVFPINWIGVALLFLAMTLFVLEAKFASHGILGTGGAVAMILGAVLLVEGPPAVRIHLGTAIGVTLPFAGITIFLVSLVIRARANKVLTGPRSLVDEVGVARTTLSPAGKIFVHGEYWDAVCSATVEAGQPVRVRAVEGLRLKVDPV